MMLKLPVLIADLKLDEGLRLKPYHDSEGVLTIGYGRNLDDVGISQDEAESMLAADAAAAEAELDRVLPWWRELPEPAQRGLANMAFNLGLPRLSRFKKMIAALRRRDFNAAADEALDSKWAGQVGDRAVRIADMYRSVKSGKR